MYNERNTPKSNIWEETVSLINGFGDSFTHPSGLTVNQCLAEHRDLARMVHNGYGADPNETQTDRDKELEGCVGADDWNIIFEFYAELTEKIVEILNVMEQEGGDIYFLRAIRARQKEIQATLETCKRCKSLCKE